MSSFTTITPEKLARLIGTPNSPALIDVRTEEDFAADARLIPGALRRTAEAVADWGKEFVGRAGALSAITAAVLGVIINLSIWFALHSLFLDTLRVRRFGLSFHRPVLSSVDIAALVLAIAAATAVFRFKAGILAVLGGSRAAGLVLRLAGLI
jgi:rhodanese-related sulfurtransferase